MLRAIYHLISNARWWNNCLTYNKNVLTSECYVMLNRTSCVIIGTQKNPTSLRIEKVTDFIGIPSCCSDNISLLLLFLLLLLLLFYFYKLFCSGTVLRKWQFILTSYPAIESNSQFYEDIIWHTQKKDVIPQESVIHIGISRCCYVWQVLMSYLVLKWSYQAYMLFLGLNYIAFFWIGPKADRISTTRT